jgi:predicted nucleic acid-binding protein
MTFLVDMNVLLRMIQQRDPMYADARRATATLIRQNHQLSIIAQNLIEFWAVATRPESSNGLGLSVVATAAHISTFKQAFPLSPDTPDIFPEWERLVQLHSVSGRQSHDARLVAAMLVHDVTHILTFNTDDFKRYSEITVVNPQNVT